MNCKRSIAETSFLLGRKKNEKESSFIITRNNNGCLTCSRMWRFIFIRRWHRYALIFKSLFATQGLINTILVKLGILENNFNFLGTGWSAKIIIIVALIWRWTGYNMVFFLAGLQNIEYSVYEAAKIDGASGWRTFWSITVPLLKPTIVMTTIMSINGTLQLFDESVNLTKGGPANATITMSHYIYNGSFGEGVANFGYASAMSVIVFIMVAILAFINLKVGDKRD